MKKISINLGWPQPTKEDEIITTLKRYVSDGYYAAEAIPNGYNFYFSNEADAIWFGLMLR